MQGWGEEGQGVSDAEFGKGCKKNNKKGRYARQKRKVKEGTCCPFPHSLTIKKDGKLQTMDEELDEVFKNIFDSVFNGNIFSTPCK